MIHNKPHKLDCGAEYCSLLNPDFLSDLPVTGKGVEKAKWVIWAMQYLTQGQFQNLMVTPTFLHLTVCKFTVTITSKRQKQSNKCSHTIHFDMWLLKLLRIYFYKDFFLFISITEAFWWNVVRTNGTKHHSKFLGHPQDPKLSSFAREAEAMNSQDNKEIE